MIDTERSVDSLRAIWKTGPGMHKNESDLARYERVIEIAKPKVIVETGLYYGGSQLWFADRVPHVINVELDTELVRDFRENRYGLGFPPPNGHIVEGNSHDVFDEVAALTRELAGDGPVMVVLDSDHGTNTVYGEMLRYGQLVTPGSYMIVEDGILHYLPVGPFLVGNWFDGDPVLAIERYHAEHDDFTNDFEIENMLPTTQHPGGWLVKRAEVPATKPEAHPVAANGSALVSSTTTSDRMAELERDNERLRRAVVSQAIEIVELREAAQAP